MTIGQRIAQKRKELGLSQEGLGERLGVSRQAIYKWESDQALPEIEKLVTLSREFSVSVGWLLGVEDDPAPEGQSADSGALTLAQLKMVEEIVDRYLAAQPKPAPTWRKTLLKVCVAVAAVCLVVVFADLFSRLDSLKTSYNNLQYSVTNINTDVSNQISSITGRVEEVLKAQNDLTADYSAVVASTDYAANTVTFDLWAVPKTYTEGMTALFTASGDSTGQAAGVLGEGNGFSAQLTCALADDITLSVVFDTGESQQTQMLDNFTYLLSASYPNVFISSTLWGATTEDGQLNDLDAFMEVEDDDGKDVELQSVRLGLFRDQKLVMWYDQPEEQPSSYVGEGWEGCAFFRLPENVTLEEGRVYCTAALVTDQYGRAWMACNGDTVTYDAQRHCADYVDADYSSDPADWEF